MATESPMRLVGSGGSRKWPSSEEAATLASSSNNVAAEELGLLLRGHRFHGNGRDAIPNRSGSAPPSMEGSFAAIGNLIGQQTSNAEPGWLSLNNANENYESEEQLRADPAYVAYYYSNANLNPRLPPPLISRENRRLAQHIGVFGDNRILTSFDDSSSEPLFFSRVALSTHKEEPEEERSPVGGSIKETSNDWAHGTTGFLSGHFTNSSAGRHKSLVDLIQEDFPRTPSPVYNQIRPLTHTATEEAIDPDAHLNLLRDSSISTVKLPEPNTMSINIRASTPTLGRTGGSVSNTDPSPTVSVPVPSSSSTDKTASPQPSLHGDSSTGDVQLDDDVLVDSVINSGISSMEATLKGLNISNLPKAEDPKRQQEKHYPQQINSQQYHSHLQRGTTSQGLHRSHSGSDHVPYGSKFSSSNLVPNIEVLQSSGITPHLYATTTAYMASGNPFYPNLQPSSIFAPQYGLGGYALNATLLPPIIYPSHGSIPMAFDSSAGPSFNARAAGGSTGASMPPGIDLQHLYKVYGLATQPSYPDPLYMHYLQHPSEDGYNAAGSQYDPMVSGGGFLGGQTDAFYSQNPPSLAGYMADQKPQFLISGAVNAPNPRKGGFASPSYYGSPPSMGLLMPYPSSPLASPVLPASPVAASVPGRKNENFRLLGSNRNMGAYSGWQGHRGNEKFDEPKSHSFLEELKSNKARRFELSDIAGRIVEFSSDQHGSRFIQQKLETSNPEEKASVFEEVLPHASTLIADVFGNYVIQKFFEHGSLEQRKALADKLTGRILPLSLQMYGCRVIQKALEVVELDQKTQLVFELDGHVMRCVRDQNGNHVIQKCIECVPTERIEFIISAFRGQVVNLSTHPYGCRVIQRILEHCTNEQQSQGIVDEILQSACTLAQDQYGNYVTQHVLERGKPHERSQIISKLAGQIVQMSQHKFASNVIEKCLEHGDPAERELMIEEIVGQTEGNDNLLIMMKDQFANYVVQKILEICTDKQREILLERIRGHLHALKKYTYGKHIVARVEQLSVEEIDASGG